MAEIYLLTNLVNGKKYVGQTVKSKQARWRSHCSDAKRYPNDNNIFHNAIRKYGETSFCVETLVPHVTSKQLRNSLEAHFIVLYKTYPPVLGFGYNATIGGEASPMLGKHHSDSAKETIRAANIGNRNAAGYRHPPDVQERINAQKRGRPSWNKGKPHTELHKEHLRTSGRVWLSGAKHPNFGTTNSPETRAKISAARKGIPSACGMRGKKHSVETRARMSAAHKAWRAAQRAAKAVSANGI